MDPGPKGSTDYPCRFLCGLSWLSVLCEEVVDVAVGGGLDLAVEPVVADEVVFVQLGEAVLVAGVVVANVGPGCELGSLVEGE